MRRHGAAFDMDEMETGVRCIAAGIRDDNGVLVAGLSLSTPAERFDADRATQVRQTAEEISAAMGYVKPQGRA